WPSRRHFRHQARRNVPRRRGPRQNRPHGAKPHPAIPCSPVRAPPSAVAQRTSSDGPSSRAAQAVLEFKASSRRIAFMPSMTGRRGARRLRPLPGSEAVPRCSDDQLGSEPGGGAMANASVKLFLSCVSNEFGAYRDALRRALTRPNVEVKIQEDFKALGGDTLHMLEDYIG